MGNNKEDSLITSLKLNYNKILKSEIDLQKSSQIFHELGLLYKKRSFSKISLIQSAGLLVAACIRTSENKQKIQNDLELLWRLILDKAKAENTDITLQSRTNIFAKKIQRMRTKVGKMCDEIPQVDNLVFYNTKIDEITKRKIGMVRSIQEQLTVHYSAIMKYLARRCIEILGEPSCKFALVGMGSLARKEITPYSDFECIIVLEEGVQNTKNYQHTLEYFRWFAVIFQVVLISLGETILPSVAIPSLNDFRRNGGDWFYDDVAPNGISFDGFMPYACKTPLGRQQATKNKPWKTELIKPVSEMLKYLSSEEDLKNGYHLADILTQTCFVFGDSDVYSEFDNGTTYKLEQQQSDETQFFHQLKCQVAEDKNKFDPENVIQRLLVFNIISVKSAFYRSITIFVSALGKFYHMKSKSSFEIVENLKQAGVFSETDANKLKYAIAIACEARLKVYQTYKKQKDQVDGDLENDEAAKIVVNAVGKKSIYDYCLIAQSMQENLPSFEAENRNVKIIDLFHKTNGHYFEKFFLNKFLVKFIFWATFLLHKRWIFWLIVAVVLVMCCSLMKNSIFIFFAHIMFNSMFAVSYSFFHNSSSVFFNSSNKFQPFFSFAHRNFYRKFFSTIATSKKIIKEIFEKCDKNNTGKSIYFCRLMNYYFKVLSIWFIFCIQVFQSVFILVVFCIQFRYEIPWYCLLFIYDHMSPLRLLINPSKTLSLILLLFVFLVSTSIFQYNAHYTKSFKNNIVIIVLSIFLFGIAINFIFYTLLLLKYFGSFSTLFVRRLILLFITYVVKFWEYFFWFSQKIRKLLFDMFPFPAVLKVFMHVLDISYWLFTGTVNATLSINVAFLYVDNITSHFITGNCPNTSMFFFEPETDTYCSSSTHMINGC